MSGERVLDRRGLSGDGPQRVVVGAGEPVGDAPRDREQVGQLFCARREADGQALGTP